MPEDLMLDLKHLPTSDELPCADETPVDNEDQNWIPNLLLFLLEYIWKERDDWYFGVDMGVFHLTGSDPGTPVIPDGFLSLGVKRRKAKGSRNSYVLWEENFIPPILTLEIVSQTRGGEYGSKMTIYSQLGVLYYVIYNPRYWKRDKHSPFEVYKLVSGQYQQQAGDPYWMPEIGLGIGSCLLPTDPFRRDALSWFNQKGQRYLSEGEQERIEGIQIGQQQEKQQIARNLLKMEMDPSQVSMITGLSLEQITQLQSIDP